jgi:hypothetical protein
MSEEKKVDLGHARERMNAERQRSFAGKLDPR